MRTIRAVVSRSQQNKVEHGGELCGFQDFVQFDEDGYNAGMMDSLNLESLS